MLKSMPTSDKLLESAASGEVRTPPVHEELERMRASPAPMFPLDRKVARHCNRFVAIAARARLHVRVNHRAGQTQSIRSGKLLHRPERIHFFGDRSRTCI